MINLTSTYKIYEENNILHLIIHETATLKYDDAITIEQQIKSIKSKNQLRLIDIRSIFIIEDKAKHYLESPKIKSKILAQAILVGSNTNQSILDFYQGMHCKKTKIKIFVNYDMAVEWLSSLQQ